MNLSDEYKFLLQQGYPDVTEESAERQYQTLLFQPVIVGSFMIFAIIFQSALIFLIFSALLWINTTFPSFNPFEKLNDALFRKPKGLAPIEPAPPPRRFMQGMAAWLMLIAGLSLISGYLTFSYLAQGFIAVAFSALLFGKFCLGAYLYHLLTGNAQFANRTCPWSRSTALKSATE